MHNNNFKNSYELFKLYFCYFILNHLYMSAYLNNECLSAHFNLLFKLSCHCLRLCVPRLPLREHVLRAQEGNPASTYLPVSPLSQSCGLSVGTRGGTQTFSWYPVRYPDFQLVPGAAPRLSVGTRGGTQTLSWYPVRYPDFGWYPGGTLNFG